MKVFGKIWIRRRRVDGEAADEDGHADHARDADEQHGPPKLLENNQIDVEFDILIGFSLF